MRIYYNYNSLYYNKIHSALKQIAGNLYIVE